MTYMDNDFILAYDLEYIMNNMGLTYIYKTDLGVINKYKGKQNYYEVVCVDMGFITDNNSFVSLMENPGKEYDLGNTFDGEMFALDFKSFDEMTKEFKKYNPNKFLKEFNDRTGKFYTWNATKSIFEEIKNKDFLKRQHEAKKENNDLNILNMYSKIMETIISQDEQVKQVLASVYKNQRLINSSLDDETVSKLKENIIVYGPTGTGKTEILMQIAKLCDVPIVIEDATSFTESGYVGRDVSEMLNDLYVKAGMDVHFAEKGILVIDEFDKLAEGGEYGATEGPSRNGVQRSLLKILDGGTVSFREDNYDGNLIDFNTSKLTVVALGAFSGIKKNDDYSDVSVKDFIDMGIMREVMGRFSKLVPMNHFSAKDYKKILLESNLSPLNTYKKLFEEMGIKFSYDDELLDYIVMEAEALDCGARSLKTVFDGIISDELFDIFSGQKKSVHLSVPTDRSKSYVAKKIASKNRNTVGFC